MYTRNLNVSRRLNSLKPFWDRNRVRWFNVQ